MKEKTIGAPTSIINAFHKIAKDRKVIPDPIDDRKFQDEKESGKSRILLGIILNPKKCIDINVNNIPNNNINNWYIDNNDIIDNNIILILIILSIINNIPDIIDIIAPKDNIKWKWAIT